MNNFNIPLILLAFGIFGCSSTKNFDPQSYKGSYIEFGTGGGIAGIHSGYILNDRGELFNTRQDSISFVKKIPKDQVSQIKNNIEILKVEEFELSQPGNVYKTLKIKNADGKEISHVWSISSDFQTENLELIHSILSNTLK